MHGMGTILNVVLIICGSLLGLFIRHRMKDNLKETLMMVCGIIILLLGMSGTMQYMLVIVSDSLHTTGPMMMIISMVLGAIIGELIDFDRRITAIGEWLKLKTGNSRDPQFTNAFITASIQDGLTGDYSTMVVKSILDGIIVMVMASSMGKGALFSFLPVGITQGMITGLAHLAAPLMTPETIDNLSYVGSILIFCVGINVLWPNKIRVANLLPAIFIAMLLTFLPITL